MRKSIPELRQAIDPRLEWIHDKKIGPEWNQRGESPYGVVWRILAGGYTVRTEHKTWSGGPGDWVFLLPCRRFQTFRPGTRLISICYRFARLRGSSWYAGPVVLTLRNCPELDAAANRLVAQVESVKQTSPIGWDFSFMSTPVQWLHIDLAFRNWLLAAMTTLESQGVQLAESGMEDDRVARALAIIERDPWMPESEPTALANGIGISRRRLEQLFASAVGHGIAEERDNFRLIHAQELLLRPKLQVKQIASRLGFSRSQAFSAWFRRHAGMSPRTFIGTAPMAV